MRRHTEINELLGSEVGALPGNALIFLVITAAVGIARHNKLQAVTGSNPFGQSSECFHILVIDDT